MPPPPDQVQRVLDQLVAAGPEIGLQVAAYLDGELIVDAWAGYADPARTQPVDGSTLFTASSTGKGPAASCIHLLADCGLLDYDTPVCTYWPEFAAHGKSRVTVRHVLSHTAGVPNPPAGFDTAMMIDWPRMCRAIADLPLSFEPGTRTAYHNYTFGYLVGEIVQRVDGRHIAQFLQEEVCQPQAVDSLFFGVPASALGRVATRVPDNEFNRPEVRQACIPSSGLITNARSLARHYARLPELVSPRRLAAASELQTDAMDDIWHVRVKRGLGYRLGDDTGPGAGPRAFGHVGAAMFGYLDPERHFAMAFLKNYIDSTAGWDVARAVYASIDASERMDPTCSTV
ncbi:MAG: beta-lactamase family protein [Chloroflexi bacterium]|nr:beta-lactamase family protein [Chloroflexota bacterium]